MVGSISAPVIEELERQMLATMVRSGLAFVAYFWFILDPFAHDRFLALS